jgi:hypothetical protein
LGEFEDRSLRVGGNKGRPAVLVKPAAAAVARVREREKEKRKKSARVLSMN